MPKDSPPFQMPEVHKGEVVLFKPSRSSIEWAPLRVTGVYVNNIQGVLVTDSGRAGTSDHKMNVVHMDDPRLDDGGFVARQREEGDQGVFVLNTHRLRMEARLDRLEEAVARLEQNPNHRKG